jgi:hypothetical protein
VLQLLFCAFKSHYGKDHRYLELRKTIENSDLSKSTSQLIFLIYAFVCYMKVFLDRNSIFLKVSETIFLKKCDADP